MPLNPASGTASDPLLAALVELLLPEFRASYIECRKTPEAARLSGNKRKGKRDDGLTPCRDFSVIGRHTDARHHAKASLFFNSIPTPHVGEADAA
jgi:hypothetical protein